MCTNDDIDDFDGKGKNNCGDEAYYDIGDGYDDGVHDDGDADINYGNNTNSGDGMIKTNSSDYLDGGGCISSVNGVADKDAVFDTKGGVETDDGDEQSEIVFGYFAECNEIFKMHMRLVVM